MLLQASFSSYYTYGTRHATHGNGQSPVNVKNEVTVAERDYDSTKMCYE